MNQSKQEYFNWQEAEIDFSELMPTLAKAVSAPISEELSQMKKTLDAVIEQCRQHLALLAQMRAALDGADGAQTLTDRICKSLP
jgi:hypothetical protein